MTTPTDRDLLQLTDDLRRADAVESRRREMWLRRQAEEEGTFHGMLVDLTERQGSLALHTLAGRVLRGPIATLGADFIGIRGARGQTGLVPLAVVTSISPEPGTAATVGDRAVAGTATLDVTVANLAAERPPALVHTTGTERASGRLWTVGRDFLVVRSDSAVDRYVPFAALNDLTFG